MKRVIIIWLLLFPVAVTAQQLAYLKFKTGSRKQVRVLSIEGEHLITNKGVYLIENIERVRFDFMKRGYRSLADSLLLLGVPVVIDNRRYEPVSVLYEDDMSNDIDMVYKSLDQFRIQRNTGKALQLFGVIGSVVALGAGANIPPPVHYTFAAMSLTGFLVDLDAGKYLLRKRK